jgi:hypothetical protein
MQSIALHNKCSGFPEHLDYTSKEKPSVSKNTLLHSKKLSSFCLFLSFVLFCFVYLLLAVLIKETANKSKVLIRNPFLKDFE